VPSPASSPSPAAAGERYRIVPERSEAAYISREKFLDRPFPNDAIGKTKELSGEIVLEQPGVPRGRVVGARIDLRTLKSDSDRRDNFVRRNILRTDDFPFLEVNSTQVAGPTSYTPGSELELQLPTTVTVRGQPKPATWSVKFKLADGAIIGTATTTIKLTEMGIPSPSIANMLTVEDEMRWQVDIVAERAR
jgi:polyisoprenoid-binding protein YceI